MITNELWINRSVVTEMKWALEELFRKDGLSVNYSQTGVRVYTNDYEMEDIDFITYLTENRQRIINTYRRWVGGI